MDIVSGIVVYLLTWWMVLFCILPWGNSPAVEGEAPPANPRLIQKFILTTLFSAIIWLIIDRLIDSNVISFHDMAREMAEQDLKMEQRK